MTFRSPWASPLYRAGVATARRLCRLAGRDDAPLIRRLVAAQNARVRRHVARHPVRSVLLILPRCLGRSGCPVDVRGDLAVCADCRRCPLGEVARLAARPGVRALVAFRSHHAFAMARAERPDLIVASACEDRLVKALRSVPEIPALLAPLTGLARPCVGAEFDLAWVADQVRAALGAAGDDADAPSPAVTADDRPHPPGAACRAG
ncbi:MAG: DUF116 domain-containing protein [Candidatus Krumholzibacteriia bacterium]